MANIRCQGCSLDSGAKRSSAISVGEVMTKTGFEFIMVNDGSACWVCPSCTKVILEGYRTIQKVLKNLTPDVSLYMLSLLNRNSKNKKE